MIRTHLDLFSGIGGFALAAKRNGLKTIQFVENNKYCHWNVQRLLQIKAGAFAIS
jgi:site-specific DNA-cytosine methylase